MAEKAQCYPYSSAAFYCLGIPDVITVEDPTFIEFGLEINQRRKNYIEFLSKCASEEEVAFSNLEEPKGDKEFIRKLIKEDGRYMPKRRGCPLKRIVA